MLKYELIVDGQIWQDTDGETQWEPWDADALVDMLEHSGYTDITYSAVFVDEYLDAAASEDYEAQLVS